MADKEANYKIKFSANTSGIKKSSEEVQRFNGLFAQTNRSYNQLNAILTRLQSRYNSSMNPQKMKEYSAQIDRVKNRMKSLEDATASYGKKSESVFGKIKNLTGVHPAAIGAGVLAKQGFDFLASSSQSAAQVEKYGVALKTLLASASGASDRMQEYFDIAKKTPFALDEVVESGNKLQSLGQYSRENLTMLGDLAAASGKPLEQAMTAFSQLATGQKGDAVRMFRDLLITNDDWIKATGKGVSKNGEMVYYNDRGVLTTYNPSGYSSDIQQKMAANMAESRLHIARMDRYKPVSAEEMQEAQLASEAYLKSIMRLEGQIYGTEKQNTDLLKEKQNTDLVEENKKTKIENSTIENDTAKSITGGGPKIINISIGKFLDAINITTNNLRDSENEIEARILDMFGRIVVQGGYAQ